MIDTMFNEGGASGLGYSEIEAYLRCPKEYQLAKVRGIGKPTSQTPDYFAVGSFVHAGRARWFAEKQALGDDVWEKIRADITKTRSEFPLPCSEDSERTALRYIQEYVDHWSVRAKPNIVAVEHMLGPVELSPVTEDSDGGRGTSRTARLDDFGFYEEGGGKLCIGECKTTSGSITDVVNQYTLHGQVALQRILWDLAPQGAAMYGQVAGTILDVIQKGYGGKKCQFARLFVPCDERVLLWAKQSLIYALEDKHDMSWDTDTERHVTSCTRLVGRARVACPFRDLCMHGRAGAIGFAFADGRSITDWKPSPGQMTPPWD